MLEFELRRKKVFEQMKDNSVAIFFSGVSKIASEDEMLPFVANKNFFYLTNIKQEHSALLLIKSLGEKKAYLFIDPYSELKEKWTGKRLTVDKAMALSEIKNVYTTDNFETMVKLALPASIPKPSSPATTSPTPPPPTATYGSSPRRSARTAPHRRTPASSPSPPSSTA